MSTRSAFVRGGLWALLIGLPILATPLVIGWLKPGPTDPRVYSNLLLMPIFSIPIFIFGGFVGMLRSLSRQAEHASNNPIELPEANAEQAGDWAHQRTHNGPLAAIEESSRRTDG